MMKILLITLGLTENRLVFTRETISISNVSYNIYLMNSNDEIVKHKCIDRAFLGDESRKSNYFT